MRSNPESRRLSKSVLVGSTAIILGLGFGGGSAFAQASGTPAPAPAAAPATSNEVVITGSRIVRKDYTAPSPIVTVNAQSFARCASR